MAPYREGGADTVEVGLEFAQRAFHVRDQRGIDLEKAARGLSDLGGELGLTALERREVILNRASRPA